MHSPSPPLDDPRAVVMVLRQVGSASVPQVLSPAPVLRRCEDEAVSRRRSEPYLRRMARRRL
jgi:hypothetical protein